MNNSLLFHFPLGSLFKLFMLEPYRVVTPFGEGVLLENVDDMHEKASNIIAVARKEASSIRSGAYNEAKTLGESKISDFKMQLDAKYDLFVADLNSQTTSLKLSLVEQLPTFKKQLDTKISSI